jgi:endonuclease/exonuclease/phosphatase family metal-dependent hydrolase
LPQLDERCEPRVLEWVRLDAAWGPLDVVNVHLGLSRAERRLQAEALLGSDWLGDPALSPRLLVLGDFNSIPGSFVYRRIARVLDDAQKRRVRATFPALFPIVRIDHIFVGAGLSVRSSTVLGDSLARVASDHRPLVAEIELSACQREARRSHTHPSTGRS